MLISDTQEQLPNIRRGINFGIKKTCQPFSHSSGEDNDRTYIHCVIKRKVPPAGQQPPPGTAAPGCPQAPAPALAGPRSPPRPPPAAPAPPSAAAAAGGRWGPGRAGHGGGGGGGRGGLGGGHHRRLPAGARLGRARPGVHGAEMRG